MKIRVADYIADMLVKNGIHHVFSVTGGANGDCDIDGLDGGTTGFIRQLFNSNELTTDEAICGSHKFVQKKLLLLQKLGILNLHN